MLWAVGSQAQPELVASVQLPEAIAGLAWVPGAELPTFLTASQHGLQQWRLQPEELASAAVHLTAALRGVGLTAVAVVEAECGTGPETWLQRQGQGCTVVVGDGSGRVWLLDVDSGQDVRSVHVLAEVQGQSLSCLRACGPGLVAAGTAAGALLLLAAEGGREKDDPWRLLCCEQLDGAVLAVQLDAGSREARAATGTGTVWQVSPGAAPQVTICGQQHSARSWHMAPGAAWSGGVPVAAVASASGVAVWPLRDSSCAPMVEFNLPADATHASLADDASLCAAAYADGSLCLFDAAAACLCWKVAAAAQYGGVVALAVVQRLRGCKVMVAYR